MVLVVLVLKKGNMFDFRTEYKNVEEYLLKHAVLDGNGNMDGYMVPFSIAQNAIELVLKDKISFNMPSNIRYNFKYLVCFVNEMLKVDKVAFCLDVLYQNMYPTKEINDNEYNCLFDLDCDKLETHIIIVILTCTLHMKNNPDRQLFLDNAKLSFKKRNIDCNLLLGF